MIRFFTDKELCSCPGSPIKIIYSPVVNEDGTIDLIESGKENLDEYIGSFAESCDIEVLIKRFTAGEIGVFNQRPAMYGDYTDMPKSFAEFLQLQIDSEKQYNALPADVKAKFDNDKNKFFATAGTESWYKNLGIDLDDGTKENDVNE